LFPTTNRDALSVNVLPKSLLHDGMHKVNLFSTTNRDALSVNGLAKSLHTNSPTAGGVEVRNNCRILIVSYSESTYLSRQAHQSLYQGEQPTVVRFYTQVTLQLKAGTIDMPENNPRRLRS
jgi:hypothetical protein